MAAAVLAKTAERRVALDLYRTAIVPTTRTVGIGGEGIREARTGSTLAIHKAIYAALFAGCSSKYLMQG